MIDTDLLDLINSGNAWVFVGSGVSVEAGLPTWANLVSMTLARLTPDDQDLIQRDNRFQKAQEHGDFAQSFQRMQDIAGAPVVIGTVKNIILDKTGTLGDLTRLLADWPAAGYLTTNYDDLIESALRFNNLLGWISVGNQPSEVRKASGDVGDIVWHIHGSAHLPDSVSRLVVGSSDYDDLYLENSELQQQFRSFLTQRRLVFVGFGLHDPEIMRLLKIAGRYTVPERPIYAFLGSRNLQEDESEYRELRERYNIEVKRYRIIDDSHRDLRELLEIYSSMIVRRSVKYGQRQMAAPSYDPDTTGLLIYNTLVLQAQNGLQDETLGALLSARILSLTEHRQSVTLYDLYADVGRIATQMSGQVQSSKDIEAALVDLQERDLITVDGEGDARAIRLTATGHSFVGERAGITDRIRDQFRASLVSRADEHMEGNDKAAGEVATAASHFFEACIEKRSLGVAMALNAPDVRAQEFQVVALLQALPEFFSSLSDPDSARALIKLVQGVLSAPSEAEAKHCGLLLQARLGVHLLGVDENTLKTRIRELGHMAFVLDSSSLIPLLAVSGTGHRAAIELLRRIRRVGAKAMTTRNLVVEVCEHAAYATRAAKEGRGANGSGVLNNLMGKEGQRTNVFLSGFAEECANGSITGNGFDLYLRQRCGFETNPPTIGDCSRLMEKHHVLGMYLPDMDGFVQEDHFDVEDLRARIEGRRRQFNNYRHDRQVLAEAEVVVLVRKLREKQYTVADAAFDGVFFVSNSRFIDQLSSVGLPVTMRESVLLQWLGTVAPFEESELPVLMDGLLWELSERGIDFVDRKKLRTAFGGTISAARDEYHSIVEQHKILIATEWGVDPESAFREPLDDLDILTVVPRHALQTIDRQKRELQRIQTSIGRNQASQELSESEKKTLERLKSEKTMRSQRNRRKARGRASKPKQKGR